MSIRRRSISLSAELDDALNALLERRGEERSRLIETLLRENPYVSGEVTKLRRPQVNPGTKRGRSIDELRVLARVGRSALDKRIASGEVVLDVRR